MNTGSVFSFMDFIVIACGAYVIYLYAEMKRTGKIRENMLLPKGINIRKCKDKDGFISYIGSRQLILGIVALLCGAAGLLQDYTAYISTTVYMLSLVLFLACAVWYTVAVKKALKKFW